MKKTLILLAAAASFMLTGCTDSDLTGGTSFTEGSSSGAIQFSAKTGNTGMTRAGYAGDLTNASIKESSAGFGVFAYYSETQKIKAWGNWDVTSDPMVSINKAPNFMYNEKLTWSNTKNGWDYSPVKYWPNGTDAANVVNVTNPSNTATEAAPQYLSFFAYAPYVAETTTEYQYDTANSKIGADTNDEVGEAILTVSDPTAVQNGIVAMSKNDANNDMYVKYILNPAANEGKFVDLTWGLRGQLTYRETDNNDNIITTLGSEYNTDLTKQVVDEKVKFLFKHALSRVGGSTSSSTSGSGSQVCGLWAVVDVDANSTTDGTGLSNQTTYFSNDFSNAKTLVTIESVKIRDKYSYAAETDPSTTETSDFLTDGWFDIMNGTWSNTATEVTHTTGGNGATYSVTADNTGGTGVYELNADIKEGTVDNAAGADWTTTNSGGATGVTLTKKKVYADEDVPGLLLIPGDGSNTLYITVKYHVRTADSKLSTGFSHVTQTITNKVTLDGSILNPNKYYNLVMHLGLTSVKFEAVVSDWSNGNDEYDEEGGETTPGDGNDNSIWLPSNVVTSPQVGDIYYSDGTFSSTLEAGKTPIGIIAYVGNDEYTEKGNGGGHGLVLALKDASIDAQWASDDKWEVDLNMTKITTGALATTAGNISGYTNTNTITEAGNATGYPAAWAAKNYTPAAPTGSTGWFLPSAGQWYKILQNLGGVTESPLFWVSGGDPHMGAAATVVDALNAKFTAKSLGSGTYIVFNTDTGFWSSSECDSSGAVYVYFRTAYGVCFIGNDKDGDNYVRPVLAF